MNRYGVSTFILLCLCSFSVTPVFAAITGHVTDGDGNPVSGALVTFTDEDDEQRAFSATTDNSGYYELILEPTAVENAHPAVFSLGQNYPNPFNPATTIPFTLERTCQVTLTIYNVSGQRIRTLIDDSMVAGNHSATWNGADDGGRMVGAGVYLYRLASGSTSDTQKMLLLDGGMHSGSGRPLSTETSPLAKTAVETKCRISVKHDDFLTCWEYGVQITDDTNRNFEMSPYSTEVSFFLVPGDQFQMGDVDGYGDNTEWPRHMVTLTSYEMSAYEVTNLQYITYIEEALLSGDVHVNDDMIVGLTGPYAGEVYFQFGMYRSFEWLTYTDGVFEIAPHFEGKPISFVSWYGAKAFADYYGYDLPTEAEWEYACRGDNNFKYGTVDGILSSLRANIRTEEQITSFTPENVGSYPQNPFGLHDMCGNVAEWCLDWYEQYSATSQVNPTGPLTGVNRVIRDDSFLTEYVTRGAYRSSHRRWNNPDSNWVETGFRVVRRLAFPF